VRASQKRRLLDDDTEDPIDEKNYFKNLKWNLFIANTALFYLPEKIGRVELSRKKYGQAMFA